MPSSMDCQSPQLGRIPATLYPQSTHGEPVAADDPITHSADNRLPGEQFLKKIHDELL